MPDAFPPEVKLGATSIVKAHPCEDPEVHTPRSTRRPGGIVADCPPPTPDPKDTRA